MGKGDKKTKRGKIILGSFGVRRPHRPKALAPATEMVKKSEKIRPEKSKVVKHTDTVVESITKPGEVAGNVVEKPEVEVKKVAKPKTAKKTTENSEQPKETPEDKAENTNEETTTKTDTSKVVQ
jgi:30S ribosomal protein S31